ncbi:MAG: sugar phosphate isomerase/epimerase family protein, partial [Planctomycetaceae bacterium]
MPAVSRRELLSIGLGATAAATLGEARASEVPMSAPSVRYCLNTSTVRGQKLDLPALVDVAAKAGYGGIEPWINEITAYRDAGGSLDDVRKRLADAGLAVESAIGFAEWIVDDDAQRTAGLEAARRDMELVAKLGGARIAAPPAGATKERMTNYEAIAERYAALCRVGESIGVVPQLEVWGFSATLSRLGETLYVLSECGHSSACLLPDVYHIYKGGSPFEGLAALAGAAVHVFHMNDYPAEPPRESIGDADRVFPGDGTAPLDSILTTLFRNGFCGALSLELFNRGYWQQPAEEVARTGLAKMRAAVERVQGNQSRDRQGALTRPPAPTSA